MSRYLRTYPLSNNLKKSICKKSNLNILTDSNGDIFYIKGKYKVHREDGPAIIRYDGIEEWYIDGKRHRADGPAITNYDKRDYWYYNGSLHREGGPAIYGKNGFEEWSFNGLTHRIGGPAISSPETNYYVWMYLDMRHRVDGPAVICDNNKKYYYKDKLYREVSSDEEWIKIIKTTILL